MKGLLGIVVGFLVAYILFKNGGFSIGTPLGSFSAALGNPNAEQIDGSTTTYSLDGNAASGHIGSTINPLGMRPGGCGCGCS